MHTRCVNETITPKHQPLLKQKAYSTDLKISAATKCSLTALHLVTPTHNQHPHLIARQLISHQCVILQNAYTNQIAISALYVFGFNLIIIWFESSQ